jgi:hypothetical protein
MVAREIMNTPASAAPVKVKARNSRFSARETVLALVPSQALSAA